MCFPQKKVHDSIKGSSAAKLFPQISYCVGIPLWLRKEHTTSQISCFMNVNAIIALSRYSRMTSVSWMRGCFHTFQHFQEITCKTFLITATVTGKHGKREMLKSSFPKWPKLLPFLIKKKGQVRSKDGH